jgi:very-short-patch-repair endonuclease
VRASLPLERQCELIGLPKPVAEFRFHPTRRWRFDWAWPDRSIAVEVDGAVFTGGRHTRGAGYEKDLEKLSEALCLGWRVLRVSTGMVRDGRALGYIERLLKG